MRSTFKPVCASKGVTFANACVFQSAKCKDEKLSITSTGECTPATTSTTPTASTDESACKFYCIATYEPVCGSDGVTYPNECTLRRASCEAASHSKITQVHEGECASQAVEHRNLRQVIALSECAAMCTQEYAPVCATNGETYGNMCKYEVAKCQQGDATMDFAHDGSCRGDEESNQ